MYKSYSCTQSEVPGDIQYFMKFQSSNTHVWESMYRHGMYTQLCQSIRQSQQICLIFQAILHQEQTAVLI